MSHPMPKSSACSARSTRSAIRLRKALRRGVPAFSCVQSGRPSSSPAPQTRRVQPSSPLSGIIDRGAVTGVARCRRSRLCRPIESALKYPSVKAPFDFDGWWRDVALAVRASSDLYRSGSAPKSCRPNAGSGRDHTGSAQSREKARSTDAAETSRKRCLSRITDRSSRPCRAAGRFRSPPARCRPPRSSDERDHRLVR